MRFISIKSIAVLLVVNLMFAAFVRPLRANTQPAIDAVPQTDQAGTALKEGRRLLKRGKTDQALGQLQTALSLYTAAKNNSGIAASHNELGDLYLRQGQYQVALDHYQKAYEAFSGA